MNIYIYLKIGIRKKISDIHQIVISNKNTTKTYKTISLKYFKRKEI